MPSKPKPGERKPAAETKRQAGASAEAARKQRQSDLLDDALTETFPASDPVSVVRVR